MLPHLGLVATFTAILSLQIVSAFNPTWNLVIGYKPPADDPVATEGGKSKWGRPHEAMTKRGVSTWYKPWFGLHRATRSMDKARKEIIKGTTVVDEHGDSEAELAEAHCDDEKIKECHERLKKAKTEIKNMLKVGDVTSARSKLGRMLHTVQDFYSHTNWVEMGHRSRAQISQKLSREWPLEFDLAPIDVMACQDCGYGGVPRSSWPKQRLSDESCRKHVNPSDPLNIFSKGAVGVCIKAKELFSTHVPPDCRDNLLPDLSVGKKYLTSGYFGTNYTLRQDKPPYKCSHGGPFDRDATGREGISKDTSSPFMSPHWYEHKYAAALADRATIQYIDDVREELCGKDKDPKECGLLRLLFGVRPTFTDPDASTAAISALRVGDGGDCPELAMAGIQNVVPATSAFGQVFIWTDGGAKDAAQTAAQLANMLVQGNIISLLDVDIPTNLGPRLPGRAERTASFTIPVDPSLSFIGFTLNESATALTITNPPGAVSDTTPGVTVLPVGTAVTYTVNTPLPGAWSISVTGDAAFSLSVFGESALQLSTFDFVSFSGARHDGWFPVRETPPPGSEAWAHAIIEGDYSRVEFEFRARTREGQLLGKVAMTGGEGDDDQDGDAFVTPRNYYYGKTTVPVQAFNVYAVGEDKNGVPFQRLLPGIMTFPPSPFNTTILTNHTTPAVVPASTPIPTNKTTTTTTITSHHIYTNSATTTVTLYPTCEPIPSPALTHRPVTASGVSGLVQGSGVIIVGGLVATSILVWGLVV